MTRRWISGGFVCGRVEFEALNPVNGQTDLVTRIFHHLRVTSFNEGDARASVTFTLAPPNPLLTIGGQSSITRTVAAGQFQEDRFAWEAGTRPLQPGVLFPAMYVTIDSNQDVIPGGQIEMFRHDRGDIHQYGAALLTWYPRANLPPERPPITTPGTPPVLGR